MYYNARYYNPQTGLFIQADSVDDGLNKYQYVAGNPINNIDPSGNRMSAGDDGGGSKPPRPSSSGLQLSYGPSVTASTGTQLGSSIQTNSTVNNMTNLCDSQPDNPQCGSGDIQGFYKTMGGALVVAALPVSAALWGAATTYTAVDTAVDAVDCVTGSLACGMNVINPFSTISNTVRKVNDEVDAIKFLDSLGDSSPIKVFMKANDRFYFQILKMAEDQGILIKEATSPEEFKVLDYLKNPDFSGQVKAAVDWDTKITVLVRPGAVLSNKEKVLHLLHAMELSKLDVDSISSASEFATTYMGAFAKAESTMEPIFSYLSMP